MNILTVILASAISLCGSWQFRCTSPEGEWHQGTVPGCVHTDLLSLGMIQDPFYGDNEKRLQWIGEKDWEYARTFDVTAADLAQSHVELVFEGLDTYASVYVNDVPVLRSDNIFFMGRLNTHRLGDPKPDFQAVSVDGGVALGISCDSPVLGLYLDIDGVEQKSISDNWMDIIPGFGKTIEISTSLSPEELLEKIEYKSINHIMQ